MINIDSIIDFFKTLKKPSVNFFTAVLLVVFAPDEWRLLAIFPAAIFLGWLWEFIYHAYMVTRETNKLLAKIQSLEKEELQLLDRVRQEKTLTFSENKSVDDIKGYILLRGLERKVIIECSVNYSYGTKYYHFSVAPSMHMVVQKYFENINT